MAFKTGGLKTTYVEEYGYFRNEYTIYKAVESVTDTCVYKMTDNKDGSEKDITITAEDDTSDFGKYSLIDCITALKKEKDIHYKNKEHDIKIMEMTSEEMNRIYRLTVQETLSLHQPNN